MIASSSWMPTVEHAHVMSDGERSGMPVSPMDALIAATCRAHGATLATRNVQDFVSAGLQLVDPWTGSEVQR